MVSNFKRYVYGGNWAFSTAATSGFFRHFTPGLNALNNLGEYQAVFDQYKINGIKITVIPRWDGADVGTTAAPGLNMMYLTYCVDPKSTLVPSGTYTSATLNTFLENCNGKTRTRMFNKPVNIYFKPMISARDLYSASTTTNYVGPKWIATESSSIAHRGVYMFLHDNNLTTSGLSGWSVDIFYTFYFQCKGNK